MVFKVDLTLDCADATRLAQFYKTALGYEDEPPPAPYATRAEWLAQFGEEDTGDGAWLHDPNGVAPRLCLLRVPEPKTAKNRLHMDVRVAGTGTPEQRWARIVAAAERYVAAGATVLGEFEGHHIVLADPEGNELCLG
ncbi:VOC family protein [Actinokineospora globicatena]|uniref:VOC family protein n=1 Tax=Actinokineospora globicatena TaxID=103729 RepID=UPI0020A41481|nr:VOC family protein [Actinokineospora globicatena]MCP2306890.1 Glyoxalase-like domain-containing protein [Actinokineospora globicatena]GLW82333.1 glyoxalase [Actinokineospora globicatena]GLW89074.1 glyoxalase [Actinokineospora globicatena]